MVPLAQSFSVESKKPYPNIWTNTYGKAKVFVTSLGHNTEMIANPMYIDMVARALLWTTGHLKDDGTPAPGYAGSGETVPSAKSLTNSTHSRRAFLRSSLFTVALRRGNEAQTNETRTFSRA